MLLKHWVCLARIGAAWGQMDITAHPAKHHQLSISTAEKDYSRGLHNRIIMRLCRVLLLALPSSAVPWAPAISAEQNPIAGISRPDIETEQGAIEAEIKRLTEDRHRLEAKEQELHNAITDQTQRLQQQQRALDEQARQIQQQQRTFDEQKRRLDELKVKIDDLAQPPAAGDASPTSQAPAPNSEAASVAPTEPPSSTGPVGRAPQPKQTRPAQIADVLEQRSILTPRGTLVVDPQLQYSNSSVTHVTLDGYTILPSLTIGSIDIRSVRHDTVTAVLGLRYGVARNFELETRVPYVRRDDQTISRPLNQGADQDTVSSVSGQGVGDVELAAHYQFNNGEDGVPYLVANLRVKSDTGKSPFDVPVDSNGLPTELPRGTGFWGVQPSLTFTLPSDPAVFFGSVSYLWNLQRKINETVGTIAPGNAAGLSLGMGLALNENASFSLGYSHNSVQQARQNGQPIKGSERQQVGALLIGMSYRTGRRTSINFSLGIGVTQDAPDVQISLGLPLNFALHK